MPKLAEALVERKGLQDRLNRLQTRLTGSAKVQEGDSPDEVPDVLLAEAERTLAEIMRLTIQINRTNSQSTLTALGGTGGNGQTIMESIAERDRLHAYKSLFDSLGNAARIEPTNRGFGVTRNEVKWRSTVDIAALQKQIDMVAQAFRMLDTRIQEANWLTELIET